MTIVETANHRISKDGFLTLQMNISGTQRADFKSPEEQ